MRRHLLVLCLALFFAILVYPSSILHPFTTLPDDNDTRLIAYIIGQVQNNLVLHQPLYHASFFAPYKNTLAYSDLFLTTAVLTLPFRLIATSPIFIYNIAYLLLFCLTFFSSFLLFGYILKKSYPALLATLIFNLSGFHIIYLPHLQVFSLWPLFLSLYLFLRYQYEKKPILLNIFFLTLTVQIAESLFPAYLIFFAVLFLYLARPISIKPILQRLFVFLPFWLWLVFPYLKLHFSFPEASRPIRDAAHFSLGLTQIFTLYHTSFLISLFVLSLFIKSRRQLRSFYFVLIFSLLMTLGPVLKLTDQTFKIANLPIPLPYAVFYYLFPGFRGFRTPSRFIVLTALSGTIIIAAKLETLLEKCNRITKTVLTLSLVLLLVYEAQLPRPSYTVSTTIPSVYEAVKNLPSNAVILELPVKLWNDPDHEIESLRSLYSLYHGKRRLGGFSGFSPLAWIDLVEQIKAHGLNQDLINKLTTQGITHIVENNRLNKLSEYLENK